MKKEQTKSPTSFSFDAEFLERLAEACHKIKVKKTSFVEAAVKYWIARVESGQISSLPQIPSFPLEAQPKAVDPTPERLRPYLKMLAELLLTGDPIIEPVTAMIRSAHEVARRGGGVGGKRKQ